MPYLLKSEPDKYSFDDLLRDYDYTLGCSNSFDHHTEIAPAVGIAFAIGPLHVDNGDIGIQGADRVQGFFRLERRKDLMEEMIALRDIAA